MSTVSFVKIPSSDYREVTVAIFMHDNQKCGEVQLGDDDGVGFQVSERAMPAEVALKLATDHAKLLSLETVAVHDEGGLWEPNWGTLHQQTA